MASRVSVSSHGSGGSKRWGFGLSSKAPSARPPRAPSGVHGAAPSERGGSKGARVVSGSAAPKRSGSKGVPSAAPSERGGSKRVEDDVRPEDSVSCAPAPRLLSSVDACVVAVQDVEKRLRRSRETPASSPPRKATGSGPSSGSHRSVLRSTSSAGVPTPPLPLAPRLESSRAPSAARPGSSVAPLSEMRMDMDVLTGGMQKAMGTVRAAEHSLNSQSAEYAQRMEATVDVAHRSEDRLGEELRQRTKDLFETQVALEALQSEIEDHRASAAADSESRNALLQELAKANEALVSTKRGRQGLKDELQQARDELSARHAELQKARDELQACSEGTSAARLRGEELEDRLAGLQEAERTLQAELKKTQAALKGQLGMARAEIEDAHAELAETRAAVSKNHRALRDDLAQVQAELGAGQAELQRRQKCCFRLRSKKAAAPKEVPAVWDC